MATVRVSVRATGRAELTVYVVAVQEAPERGWVHRTALRDVLPTQEERNVAGCIASVLVLDARDILGRDPVKCDVCGVASLPSGSVEEGALGGAEVLADLRGGLGYVARPLDTGHWQHEGHHLHSQAATRTSRAGAVCGVALQCRSAGAMSPRLFRGFLVPLVLLVRRHVLGEFQAGNRAIAAGAPRLGRAGASFRTRRPRPPALSSLCFHLLPRWLRAAPTVDAASERRLLRDRPPLAPLCVSLRCLAACAPRPCSRQEGRSSGPTLALSEARAECYSRAQRSTTLARFGGALGEGGCRFRRAHDQHIVHWARRIGVRLLCTPTRSRYLLSASALPADSDARLLAHVGYCNLNAYV